MSLISRLSLPAMAALAAVVVLALSFTPVTPTAAGEAASDGFESDPVLGAEAARMADQAVVFAREQFDISLDFDEKSVADAERLLSRLHDLYVKEKPSEAEVISLARGMGSYVGEVYRRAHGAEWGWIAQDEGQVPGLRGKNGTLLWPWARVLARIKSGDEFDVSRYYQLLLEPAASNGPSGGD